MASSAHPGGKLEKLWDETIQTLFLSSFLFEIRIMSPHNPDDGLTDYLQLSQRNRMYRKRRMGPLRHELLLLLLLESLARLPARVSVK